MNILLSSAIRIGLFSLASLSPLAAYAATPCLDQGYWIGAAQDDITGPIAELGMMGYADLGQVDEGLHMRLRSRTLVISDACKETNVAMVIADLGQIFGGVRSAVLQRLNRELPGVFTEKNLLISATHTHSGPGGFAHHALYNITTLGFNQQNFDSIVLGISQSIVKAYRQRTPGTLSIAEGTLSGVQWNRSPDAYQRDPDAALYPQNTDEGMLLIKAVDAKGRPLASFNWFPVHPVSMPMENKLVSGDNKGLAAYYFEKAMGTSYLKDQEFIAGFVQSNSGDISPYDFSLPEAKTSDGFARNEASARAQFEKALELFDGEGTPLSGPIGFTHKFAELAYRSIDARYTKAGPQTTCNAVLGVGFAAGTENGNPAGLFKEGTVFGANWPKVTLMPEEQDCHKEKVLLLPVGFVKPDPWTAPVAPFQILRIGELAVVATPFEMTTMAGRRLREVLLETLKPLGIRYLALSTLANDYLHYVATREEYAQQDYEGGSTLYGPWTLAAYTQIFDELAAAMAAGKTLPDEAKPLDLSQKQVSLKPGVVMDTVPFGKEFGDVRTQPEPSYERGRPVRVEFWGAHPNNGKVSSYMTVEQWKGERWEAIRHDWDADTFFRWKRHSVADSIVTAEWLTDASVEAGAYRICTAGYSKKILSASVRPYQGCSATFTVRD